MIYPVSMVGSSRSRMACGGVYSGRV